MKFGEGNVFTGVCLSTGRGGGRYPGNRLGHMVGYTLSPWTWNMDTYPPFLYMGPGYPTSLPPNMGPGYPTPPPGHGTLMPYPPSPRYPTLPWTWDRDVLQTPPPPSRHGTWIPYDLNTLPPTPQYMGPRYPTPCYWHLVVITGDLFKLVRLRTETRTVSKRVVRILLECCLVASRFPTRSESLQNGMQPQNDLAVSAWTQSWRWHTMMQMGLKT